MHKSIHAVVGALLTTSLLAAPAAASDKADVLATVKHYADSFNKGDTGAAVAVCAPNAVIIDDFSPFIWQGANACGTWLSDLDTASKAAGITDGAVKMGKVWRVNLDGNHAYAVVPTSYSYKLKGKPVVKPGSVWTLALAKGADGWKITGWAWSAH
jgi:ketosteroid isomerase-like protein